MTTTINPAVGHTYLADFGTSGPWGHFAVAVTFDSEDKLSFEVTEGDYKGSTDAMPYTTNQIAPDIYVVVWKENKLGTYVTHVEDFGTGKVLSSVILPDGNHAVMTGSWRKVR
jgi:hypothetical protein